MGLFKKKTDYSYYSSYSSSRRRLKVGRTVIAVIAAVVVILGIIIYFNFNRIQFLMKGYSWSTTSELVSSFDNDEEKELLSHDEMKHILKWIDNSNKVTLYDEYERFYALHKELAYDDLVEVADYIFENQVPTLHQLGYKDSTIWKMLEDGAGKSAAKPRALRQDGRAALRHHLGLHQIGARQSNRENFFIVYTKRTFIPFCRTFGTDNQVRNIFICFFC